MKPVPDGSVTSEPAFTVSAHRLMEWRLRTDRLLGPPTRPLPVRLKPNPRRVDIEAEKIGTIVWCTGQFMWRRGSHLINGVDEDAAHVVG